MKKLLVISAVWCPSCLILNRHLKKIKSLYSSLEIEKLDYDLDEEEVIKYNIGEKLPVMIFKDDKDNEIDRLVGEKSFSEIEKWLGDKNV